MRAMRARVRMDMYCMVVWFEDVLLETELQERSGFGKIETGLLI